MYKYRKIKTFSLIAEDYIIIFMFVYGLVIPVFRTSSLLLLFLLPLRLSIEKRGLYDIWKCINSSYIITLLKIYFFLVIITLISTTIQIQLDYSLIKTIVNCIIHMIVASMSVILFLKKNRSLEYLIRVLIGIFIIQSIIEVCAFFSPSILEVVQIFQSSATIERADIFSGRRGLALSGTVFFGLSSIFGVVFFFYFKSLILEKHMTLKKILAFGVLIVGGFFTGRTYFIGVGLSCIYFLTSNLSSLTKTKIFCKLLVGLIILCIVIVALMPQSVYTQIENLLYYVFEAIYNYIYTGHATTTSSDHLLDDMYFPISLKTILIGDGLYTNDSGYYYMNTDAGYMRNILLFGILGLLISMFLDVKLLWGNSRLKEKKNSRLSFFIFIYLCILHVKGEAFAYLITMHCILFLYYFFIVFSDQLKCVQYYDVRHPDMHIQCRCH